MIDFEKFGAVLTQEDLAEMRTRVDAGLLSYRKHPTEDLWIWNYTKTCQFSKAWDRYTTQCRGLITDADGKIIGRCMPKFVNDFELEAVGQKLPDEPFEVYAKMDGSMIEVLLTEHGPIIATRGSFESTQAALARELLRDTHLNMDPEYTYIYELIHPANRICVDYGDRKELVLLAIIKTSDGTELPIGQFPQLTPAPRFDASDIAKIRDLGKDGDEGFVVRYRSGIRVKFKLASYIERHRLIFGITPRIIWEYLSTGRSLDDVISIVPEEFGIWISATAAELHRKFETIRRECSDTYLSIARDRSRKEIANEYSRTTYPSIMFLMLDGKDYTHKIWALCYPVANDKAPNVSRIEDAG